MVGQGVQGLRYAGDMVRGFDVYSFADCSGVGCLDILTSTCVGAGDADGDGLSDELEKLLGSSVDEPDSDADGIRDGNEDSDGDGEDDEDEDDRTDTCGSDSNGDGRDDEDDDD